MNALRRTGSESIAGIACRQKWQWGEATTTICDFMFSAARSTDDGSSPVLNREVSESLRQPTIARQPWDDWIIRIRILPL